MLQKTPLTVSSCEQCDRSLLAGAQVEGPGVPAPGLPDGAAFAQFGMAASADVAVAAVGRIPKMLDDNC